MAGNTDYDLDPKKRIRVHASHIKSFLMCPASFFFRYVKHVKTPTNAALVLGRAVHKAAEKNLRQKETSFIDLPEPDIIGGFEQSWDESKKEGPIQVDEGDNLGEIKDMGVACTKSLARIILPTIQPEPGTVEMPLEAPVINRGYDVAGRLDVIDQKKQVRDFKTTGGYLRKTPEGKYIPNAGDIIQVTQYSLMAKSAGMTISGTELSYIHKKILKGAEIPNVFPAVYAPTEDNENAFLRIADKLVDAVNREAYVPNPTCFVCSPEKCGYWQYCRGGAIF